MELKVKTHLFIILSFFDVNFWNIREIFGQYTNWPNEYNW